MLIMYVLKFIEIFEVFIYFLTPKIENAKFYSHYIEALKLGL